MHSLPWLALQRAGHDETSKASLLGKSVERLPEVSKASMAWLWQVPQCFLLPGQSGLLGPKQDQTLSQFISGLVSIGRENRGLVHLTGNCGG